MEIKTQIPLTDHHMMIIIKKLMDNKNSDIFSDNI